MLLLGTQVAFAQFTKGEKELITRFSGSINKSNNDIREIKSQNISTVNQFGWFLKDNLSFGVIASYRYNDYYYDQDNDSKDEREGHYLAGGLYVRRYFNLNRWAFYIQSDLAYERRKDFRSLKTNSARTTHEELSDAVSFSVNAGVQFKINEWFSLEGALNPFLNASIYNQNSINDASYSQLSFNPNFNLALSGLSFGARFSL